MNIQQYIPQYNRKEIAEELIDYVLNPDNYFSENHKTKEFEKHICEFLNVKHCITVTNGTMAIALSLLAKGIKPKDKVLVPNITMMSTQAAVELIGAVPVLVDVDRNTLTMDLNQAILHILNDNIKAVVYVSLNGRTTELSRKKDFECFCMMEDVSFIEDNAQSFGSRYSDKKMISCPADSIGCFSLSFHKLLSTGQGGFCVTNNDDLNIRLRELKNVGRVEGGADVHERFGINNKFTDLQAIIGLVELKDIYCKIDKKKWIYEKYYSILKDIPEVSFLNTDYHYNTIWFVDIYVNDRDRLQAHLKNEVITTRAMYPALNSQKLNKDLTQDVLPVSNELSLKGIWLPSSLSLDNKEIEYICSKIKEFYGK